ncbi:ABC transporter substrate-binding protein [Brevibacillus ginsengisoli]|uniref:SgrR family transcriptional regulator n=1 Tax=Brevibacillus ginsengisoli TaxID=363854 RepID=UPI003CED85A4
MQMIAHYIRLIHSIQNHQIGECRSITVDELSLVLCCTARNAKLIVKRLEEENWITWQPGRGRGNHSTITFQILPEELILRKAKERVFSGQIRQARELIDEYAHEVPRLSEQFHFWLKSQFGYHSESFEAGQLDTLRLSFFRPLLSLDPAFYWMRSEGHIIKQVCDTLVRYEPETKRLEPHLAHAWEISEDAKVWTFYLRKGVLFHNGRRLTAHDVKYSLERFMNKLPDPNDTSSAKSTPYQWLMHSVREILVINDLTVQFKLKEPNALFLQLLTHERLSILPNQLLADQEHDLVPTLLIGTGPFKLTRNDPSMIVLEAFESYFRERAHLDRIEWWVVPELGEDSGNSSERKEDVYYENGMNSDINSLQQDVSRSRTQHLERNLTFLSLNQSKAGPMQNPSFREAFARIIDQQRMVSALGGSRHEPAYGLFHVTVKESKRSSVPIEKLIKESYKGEVIRLHTFEDADHVEDATWLKQLCAEYGIQLEPYFYEPQTMMEVDCIREADIIHDSATMDELCEVSFLEMLLTANSFVINHLGQELSHFVQSTIKQLLTYTTSEERLHAFRRIEERLLAERAVIPLYRNQYQVVAHPELRDVMVNAQGWLEYRLLWFRHPMSTN